MYMRIYAVRIRRKEELVPRIISAKAQEGSGMRAWRHCTKDIIHPPENKSLIIVIEKFLTEVGAFALERQLIRWYGRIDTGTGILRNRADGGQGSNHWLGKNRPSYKQRTKKPRINVYGNCHYCGKDFSKEYTSGNKLSEVPLLYCSPSCRNKGLGILKAGIPTGRSPSNKGKRGGVPWNKGKLLASVTTQKMQVTRKGKKLCHNPDSGRPKCFL